MARGQRRLCDGSMSTEEKLTDIVLSHVDQLALRIDEALAVIHNYGGIDGAHHKQWVLDQVVRALCGSDEEYAKWVTEFNNGDEGPNTYEWDEGITP